MNGSKIGLCCLSFFSLAGLSADEPQPASACCSSFPIGGDVVLAVDYFRSLPEGSWEGNSGAFSSVNLAIGIPNDKNGFGAQVGGSYGLYDWEGRGSNATGNTKAVQQEGFVTVGLFRMTPHCSGLNVGVVYDWMYNKESSVFALDPQFSQVRGQIGYLWNNDNEFGVWGSTYIDTAHKNAAQIPVKFRAVSQVNAFWTHHFKNSAQTMLWAGTPYRRGLMYTDGRPGQFIIGASFKAPLTSNLSVVGHGSYMAARSGPASSTSKNYAANLCFGISYAFGDCGTDETPYMALADNSNFIVDTNLND